MSDFSSESDDVANKLSELQDRHVLSRTDIDVLKPGIGLEEEYQRIGTVVGMQKFASRRACVHAMAKSHQHQRWIDIA